MDNFTSDIETSSELKTTLNDQRIFNIRCTILGYYQIKTGKKYVTEFLLFTFIGLVNSSFMVELLELINNDTYNPLRR